MPRSLVRRLLASVSMTLMPLILAGCALLTPTPEINPSLVVCESFRVITYSRLNDTEETIRQIREHNAVYRELCPNSPDHAPAEPPAP